MENKYALLYYNLILKGVKTINDVPSNYRESVIRLLEENNRHDLLNSDTRGE